MPAQKYLKGNMMTNAASEVRNKYLKMRLKI